MNARTSALAALILVGCSEYDIKGDPPTIDANNPIPHLTITPTAHDFGTLDVPCGDSVEIELASDGAGDLTIETIEYAAGGYLSVTSGPSLPITLPPGQSVNVTVTVDTTPGPATDFGTLTVGSDDPEGPKTAEQAVEAEARFVMDAFTEPGIPPVDVLFLIDQSCSMQALADANIQQGMPAFIAELQNVADWQLIEVTKQDGCANGGILTPATPNAAQLLSDNAFNAPLAGLYTEKLLQHAEKALSLTDPGECNAGFLRPGASLVVLVASDEAEQSQPLQSPAQTAAFWVGEYQSYVTNPDYVTVSGILNIFSDDACSDYNGGSPDGYIEAVNLTNGVALDICQAGWGSQLTDIATNTVEGMRVYNLTEDAVNGTLSVMVNGVAATDWEFSDASNSVTIREPLIGEGDIVEIGYGVYATCTP